MCVHNLPSQPTTLDVLGGHILTDRPTQPNPTPTSRTYTISFTSNSGQQVTESGIGEGVVVGGPSTSTSAGDVDVEPLIEHTEARISITFNGNNGNNGNTGNNGNNGNNGNTRNTRNSGNIGNSGNEGIKYEGEELQLLERLDAVLLKKGLN